MKRSIIPAAILAMAAGIASAADAVTICHDSEAYTAYQREWDVYEFGHAVEGLKKQQDFQRRVQKESGLRDMNADYFLAANLVAERDRLKSAWAAYKKAGGTAKTPADIKSEPLDPCQN